MSGGDFDGDLDFVSQWRPLIDFLHMTQGAVDAIDIEHLESSVQDALRPIEVQQFDQHIPRHAQYQQFCVTASTTQTRGRVCAQAERAINAAIMPTATPLMEAKISNSPKQ